MPRIAISATGCVNFPQGGGHLWVYLQYVLGLRDLGCDVYWLERFYPTGDAAKEAELTANFEQRLNEWGLTGKLILYSQNEQTGITCLNCEPARLDNLMRTADLLLNFNYRFHPALLTSFSRTALMDIDPGLLQF